jgi:hypothetical protein
MMARIKTLNGKPLTSGLTGHQLGDCRKIFQHRATLRGAAPTQDEIDDAIWQTLETGHLPELYRPVTP